MSLARWLALGIALALVVGLMACIELAQSPSVPSYLVAFWGDSDFLGQGIPDSQFEIWLRDARTLALTRVTTVSLENRDSRNPIISADGTKVAFHSDSDFLGQGIADEQYEIWLYDTRTQALTRVTHATPSGRAGRDPASRRRSFSPVLSADGTKVAFWSDSDFLQEGIPYRQYEVWLYDARAQALTRITHASHKGRSSYAPSLSADGTKVAFYSESDLLGQGIPDEQYEVWLYDARQGKLTRVTWASSPDRDSVGPTLSADGTKIAFYSDSDFLGQGIPDEQYEIWLYDALSGALSRITHASGADRYSRKPSLSADGSRIVFESNSDFGGQGIPYFQHEIWLYDARALALTRVTTASNLYRDSYEASISPDGTKIAFHSDSDFLGQGISFRQFEIWLYDIEPCSLTRLTAASWADRGSSSPSLSAPVMKGN